VAVTSCTAALRQHATVVIELNSLHWYYLSFHIVRFYHLLYAIKRKGLEARHRLFVEKAGNQTIRQLCKCKSNS